MQQCSSKSEVYSVNTIRKNKDINKQPNITPQERRKRSKPKASKKNENNVDKRERTKMNKIINENRHITADNTEIQMIIRDQYEQLYTNKLDRQPGRN